MKALQIGVRVNVADTKENRNNKKKSLKKLDYVNIKDHKLFVKAMECLTGITKNKDKHRNKDIDKNITIKKLTKKVNELRGLNKNMQCCGNCYYRESIYLNNRVSFSETCEKSVLPSYSVCKHYLFDNRKYDLRLC